MPRRRPRQQSFAWKTVGGARPGAGRKRAPQNIGLQPHCARPAFDKHVPVHVTMRAVRGVSTMRAPVVARLVVAEIARASEKGFRILHFSVQNDHIHLIAERDDATKFSRGMQRLASRIAMQLNAVVSRRGAVWRERYHRRDLATPRQFRNALVYVTFNARKHARPRERALRARSLDLLSSAPWLDDWQAGDSFFARLAEARARAGPRATVMPRTWIASVGWKRHGKLEPSESPRTPG